MKSSSSAVPRLSNRQAPAAIRLAASGLSLEHPNTGTGRYARHVLNYLGDAEDFDTFVVADDRALVALALGAGASAGRIRIVRAPMPPLRAASYGRKLFWEQAALPGAVCRMRADVLYSPHFSTPLVSSCPTVISIHDAIPLADPAYASSIPAKAYFGLVGMAARRSAAAITLSEYAKGEIVRRLGVPADRVHVVVPGVEAAFAPEIDLEALARARERYQLPERYLLYVGGSDARKNIGVLLSALSGLSDGNPIPPLVVAAGLPKDGQAALFPDWRAEAARLALGPRVRFVERIAEEDLAAVYRAAHTFVFPSRAEGFGLPPLEAMACGTPVICSNATSLPEAVASAGILVDPNDVQAWASAILRLATDSDLHASLVAQGIERAARFRWADTGSRVASIIRGVAHCAS